MSRSPKALEEASECEHLDAAEHGGKIMREAAGELRGNTPLERAYFGGRFEQRGREHIGAGDVRSLKLMLRIRINPGKQTPETA